MYRKDICIFFLLDDFEEDFSKFLVEFLQKDRCKTHPIIENRISEGAYSILIKKYLMSEDDKFIKYFRVTPYVFQTILNEIRNEISTQPCNRVRNPICAEQKLCVALRYFTFQERRAI